MDIELVGPEDDMKPIGSRGLKNMGNVISEEYQKELRTLRQKVAVYAEMANNPYIGAALNFFETKLLALEYRIKPKKEMEKNARAIEEAAFVRECLHDMETSYEDFMSEVLTMLLNGFAAMEFWFKVRPDGRIGFADIQLRPAETIWQWIYDGDRLVGLKQQLTMTQTQNQSPEIPMNRVYLFRTSAIKNNPEGRSILRRAYEPYVRSKIHRDLEAIGHEKDATGTPVVRVPDEVAQATEAQTDLWARKQNAQKIARRLKTGEEIGVVLSSAVEEGTKEKKYDISLLSSPGARQFDASPIIERYNREMLFATGTDMILLGHEKTSSINEGGSGAGKEKALNGGINYLADRNSDVINRHLIPDLMTMNGVPEEFWPECEAQHLESEISLKDFATAVGQLTGAGMALFPDPKVENDIRSRMDLPLLDGEEAV